MKDRRMFELLKASYRAFQHHQTQLEDIHRFLDLYVGFLDGCLHEMFLGCVELENAK